MKTVHLKRDALFLYVQHYFLGEIAATEASQSPVQNYDCPVLYDLQFTAKRVSGHDELQKRIKGLQGMIRLGGKYAIKADQHRFSLHLKISML